jgi:hypothetical protein
MRQVYNVDKKNTLSALACQRAPYDVTLVGRLFEESTIASRGDSQWSAQLCGATAVPEF